MGRNFKVLAVHKQMYPATYNFRDDDVGDEPSGWIIDNGAGCTTTVMASLDGHKKVLQCYDGNAATRVDIRRTFTQGLNTIVEFWCTKNSVADNTTVNIYLFEDATNCVQLRFEDNDLDYNDGVYTSIKNGFLVANTLSHFKLILNDAANTFNIYIDGVLEGSDLGYRNNTVSGVNKIVILTDTADTGYYGYFNGFGISTDASYSVGDNCFWRHYKESDDPFEGDDEGTTGTSITWVDAVDTAASTVIVQEFGVHKKHLRQAYTSAAGGYDYCYHTFDSQSKNCWVEFWMKTNDVTGKQYFRFVDDADVVLSFGIQGSKFQRYEGAAWVDITGAPVPVNDTIYHVYIRFYDTNNMDIWIDNVLYEDGIGMDLGFTNGLKTVQIRQENAGDYFYIDAFNCSLDSESPERGDNRTFDYNATYTSKDITSDVINVLYSNSIYLWREATLISKKDYEASEVFFQIYDVNGKLAMEAEIKSRSQVGEIRTYTLRDKNWDDLNNRSSNTFSAAKIHDPTDSTSMLKVILPNVGEEDGDLLLVEGDTKSSTYSPVTKNYPDYVALRDIADLADSCVIVAADGKCYLDDDKASGTTLDFDTEADKDEMTDMPLVTDILETINYFEIFGAINPDTGLRFTKVIDNVGSDKKRSWRYTNNEFRTQTDVDNYATALENRIGSIKVIKFTAQSLGAHNMGETINYKYVQEPYNVPQANYYVVFESVDFDANLNTIILSEGMIEESKYAATFEKPETYSDSDWSGIYDTDMINIDLEKILDGGADTSFGLPRLNAVGEEVIFWLYLDDKLDPDRDVVITIAWYRVDNNNDTIQMLEYIYTYHVIGAIDTVTIRSSAADWVATPVSQYGKRQIIITSGLESGRILNARFKMNEAGRTIRIPSISIRYYQKREV